MRRSVLSLLAVACFVASNSALAAASNPKAPRPETAAPAAAVETLAGAKVHLSDLVAGKPTLLIFWATWCPTCREQAPRFKAAFDRYAPNGLNVIAVDIGVRDSVEAVKRYVAENSLPYRVLFDKRQEAVRAYGVASTPTVLLLDRSGTVVDWAHAVDFGAIEAVLAGKRVPRRTPSQEEMPGGSSSRKGSGP